jgi:hypothetical protein
MAIQKEKYTTGHNKGLHSILAMAIQTFNQKMSKIKYRVYLDLLKNEKDI